MSNPGAGQPQRLVLTQELSEFLIELSIALTRASMYPWGHPSLERAASRVITRMVSLLADRNSVSIGVARRQLVIEGVATDPTHPVLKSLAERLHRHHIGAIVFERGVTTRELAGALRLLGTELERDAIPLGLGDPNVLRQWAHVRLYPLTYEQLELLREEESEQLAAPRSAQLWVGLARAALAGEDRDAPPETTEPTAVARAINEHTAAKAYDQVIVGYLLQLAKELREEGGVGSAAVRRRLSRLIGGLDQGTLQRLIDMGGDVDQRRQFVLDASEALTVDAMVDLVQAAAVTSNQSISSSMVRLLTKMSAFAEQGPPNARVEADTALRQQIQMLTEDWSLEKPNPDAYTRALESLSKRPQAPLSSETSEHPPEALRIVQMALEVEAMGVPFWRAVAQLIEQQQLTTLIGLLEEAGPANAVGVALWEQLINPDRVRELLRAERVDFDALGRVLDRMPPAQASRLLMEALCESPLRSTRMGAFKWLGSLDIRFLEPLIIERMRDERWYVRRNLLALLNVREEYLNAIDPAPYARDPDIRVRREALLLWMRSPRGRYRAICAGLAEPDERALRAAILEASHGCPVEAVPVIVERLGESLPAELQERLIALLDGLETPEALETLLGVVTRGRTVLGSPRLAPSTPAVLAALAVLASTWPQERRASQLLKRAAKSAHAEIRDAVSSGGSAP